MAGRPRAKAIELTELAHEAESVSIGLFLAAPRDFDQREDALARQWRETVRSVMQAQIDVECLANVCRSKAGMEPIKVHETEDAADLEPKGNSPQSSNAKPSESSCARARGGKARNGQVD